MQAKMPYISLQAEPHVSSTSNNADRAQLLDKTTTQQPAPLHIAQEARFRSVPSHAAPPLHQRGGTPPHPLSLVAAPRSKQAREEPDSQIAGQTRARHRETWEAGHLCLGPGGPTSADLAGGKSQVVV